MHARFGVFRLVRAVQALSGFADNVDGMFDGQGHAALTRAILKDAEVGAVDEIEDHEVVAIGFAEVHDRDDVRVLQLGPEPGLIEEHANGSSVFCQLGQHAFDDDGSGEGADADSAGDEDLGHAADANAFKKPVAAEDICDH